MEAGGTLTGAIQCRAADGSLAADDFILSTNPASPAVGHPPERASGAAFNWAARSLAEVQIARKLYDRPAGRIPYFRYVNPYWYQGCPKERAQWDTAYSDEACSTGVYSATEMANLREVVQRAGYLLIELGGQSRTSSSIGSGGQSDWSFEELKTLIENPPGTGTPAPKVVGWYQQGGPLGEPGKLCRKPDEINPETPPLP